MPHPQANLGGEPHTHPFSFELLTSGLVNGYQCRSFLAAQRKCFIVARCCCKCPTMENRCLRLTAMAGLWQHESGLKYDQHYEIARYFEHRLSSSGQFHYSLQGQPARRIDRRHRGLRFE